MAFKIIQVSAPEGLHMRPAAQLVQEAKRFNSEISLEVGGRTSNAKSLFKLQLLEIPKGAQVGILAEGDDADAAVDHLAKFLMSLK